MWSASWCCHHTIAVRSTRESARRRVDSDMRVAVNQTRLLSATNFLRSSVERTSNKNAVKLTRLISSTRLQSQRSPTSANCCMQFAPRSASDAGCSPASKLVVWWCNVVPTSSFNSLIVFWGITLTDKSVADTSQAMTATIRVTSSALKRSNSDHVSHLVSTSRSLQLLRSNVARNVSNRITFYMLLFLV